MQALEEFLIRYILLVIIRLTFALRYRIHRQQHPQRSSGLSEKYSPSNPIYRHISDMINAVRLLTLAKKTRAYELVGTKYDDNAHCKVPK